MISAKICHCIHYRRIQTSKICHCIRYRCGACTVSRWPVCRSAQDNLIMTLYLIPGTQNMSLYLIPGPEKIHDIVLYKVHIVQCKCFSTIAIVLFNCLSQKYSPCNFVSVNAISCCNQWGIAVLLWWITTNKVMPLSIVMTGHVPNCTVSMNLTNFKAKDM